MEQKLYLQLTPHYVGGMKDRLHLKENDRAKKPEKVVELAVKQECFQRDRWAET